MDVDDSPWTAQRCDPRRLRIVPDVPRVVYLIPLAAVLLAIVLFASVMHRPDGGRTDVEPGRPADTR